MKVSVTLDAVGDCVYLHIGEYTLLVIRSSSSRTKAAALVMPLPKPSDHPENYYNMSVEDARTNPVGFDMLREETAYLRLALSDVKRTRRNGDERLPASAG